MPMATTLAVGTDTPLLPRITSRLDEIGRRFGFGESAMCRWVQRLGLPFRSAI